MNHIMMFPGLGAEYAGMGCDYYHVAPVFKATIDRLSAFLESTCNVSVKDLICNPEAKTVYQWNPVELHLAHILFHLSIYAQARSDGYRPTALLGCSLGELVCAIASGALEEEDGILTAVKQAKLFEQLSPFGGFLSIAGSVDQYNQYQECFTDTWVAAENCKSN